ncbi:MAG: orotidine-5'-phosphate decarboxylase [Planctomycetaceae bacterium]|nr:orotidine-5'-phosphate decarboxylase [Planctomycetaceae bacterium]
MTDYATRLRRAVSAKGTPACVGLDPRLKQLPPEVIARTTSGRTDAAAVARAYGEFCRRVIDVVAPLVPVVKPQAAFFEELGPPGMDALAEVIRSARNAGLIVICDAKRGDIGSTAEAYARGYLAGEDPDAAAWGADALTVNPYLGVDTLQPFVDIAVERGGGLYVLVRTSNPGAGTFQDHRSDGKPLFTKVAEAVETLAHQTASGGADEYGAVGAVVGATYPEELAELRGLMPHAPLLVPGYGSQGGTAADVAAAFQSDGQGAVVNSSRGVIFAYEQEPYRSRYGLQNWEQAIEDAARAMIEDLARHTPAGVLL